MSYFFSTPVDIDIVLDDTDSRQMVDIKTDKNRREKAPLYMDGESVRGSLSGVTMGLPLDCIANAEVLSRTSYNSAQGLQEARTYGHQGPVHWHDRLVCHGMVTKDGRGELSLQGASRLIRIGHLIRDVLRPRQPLRISMSKPGTGGPGRAATPANVRLQLQKRREAIRVVQRDQRKATVLCAGDRRAAHGRRHPREGHVGVQLPHPARDEQQHQDGRWHRGLPAHRVRVQQKQIPPQGRHCRPHLLPARPPQD